MARSSYSADPDGRTDLDRGPSGGDPRVRVAAQVAEEDLTERRADRTGQRELDDLVETSRGTRAARDRARAAPRDVTAELGHPRKARPMPERSARRGGFSARQRSERSRVKRAVQDRLDGRQHHEMRQLLVEDPHRWAAVNNALSQAAGDVQQLPDTEITRIQRVDRAIQAYERANDRGHVIYSNVQLPDGVESHRPVRFLREQFHPGDEVAFDRYTLGAHTMHELDDPDGRAPQGVAVLEIRTRRGMYLGQSGRGQSTSHLLPRGMRLWVNGVHHADYDRADGTIGHRTVIQLSDTPPTKRKKGQ
ncbi:MAG: hypothetical protein ACRC35_07925 [Angustibacter sp.]